MPVRCFHFVVYAGRVIILVGAHPEIPDGHSEVSRSEMRNFVQGQGKQGLVRRRTGVRRTNKADD
jgi:hypothetical protein